MVSLRDMVVFLADTEESPVDFLEDTEEFPVDFLEDTVGSLVDMAVFLADTEVASLEEFPVASLEDTEVFGEKKAASIYLRITWWHYIFRLTYLLVN